MTEIKSVYEIVNEIRENFTKSEDETRWGFADRVKKEAVKIYLKQYPEEYQNKCDKIVDALKRSKEKELEAAKLLDESVDILCELGLGRYFNVSPIGQSFVADTEALKQMFEVEELEEIEDLLEALSIPTYSEYGQEGWQHSAVC